MKLKQYQNRDGSVIYSYSLNSKKWEFNIPSIGYTLLLKVVGREEGAAKIANFLNGSIKRNGHVDNMARANIAKYTAI